MLCKYCSIDADYDRCIQVNGGSIFKLGKQYSQTDPPLFADGHCPDSYQSHYHPSNPSMSYQDIPLFSQKFHPNNKEDACFCSFQCLVLFMMSRSADEIAEKEFLRS
jgi:hypothetical protein